MKRLETWKKVVIIFVVIGVLIVARILLFESVRLNSYQYYFSETEKYEKFYLFEGKIRKWRSSGGFLASHYLREEETILMFQWDYDKLLEEMNQELYERLDKLVEDYEFVSSYEVNEQDKLINIYYDEAVEEKKERGKDNYYGFDNVAEYEIQKFCHLKNSFMKSDAEYVIYLYDIDGEYITKARLYN